MDLKSLWLSPNGRATRRDLWLRTYLPFLGIYVLAFILDMITGNFDAQKGYGLISALVSLILIWPWIAVLIKRCHDRDKTGWFVLLFLVPLLNLWPAIELYFLRGTTGTNRFGDDPIQFTAN